MARNGFVRSALPCASHDHGDASCFNLQDLHQDARPSCCSKDGGGDDEDESCFGQIVDSLTGHASEGVDECIADLIELLAGIWLMKIGDNGFPKEEPLSAWLKSYLSSPDENSLYDAWSWADKSV